jgi:hypothetical protein
MDLFLFSVVAVFAGAEAVSTGEARPQTVAVFFVAFGFLTFAAPAVGVDGLEGHFD